MARSLAATAPATTQTASRVYIFILVLLCPDHFLFGLIHILTCRQVCYNKPMIKTKVQVSLTEIEMEKVYRLLARLKQSSIQKLLKFLINLTDEDFVSS